MNPSAGGTERSATKYNHHMKESLVSGIRSSVAEFNAIIAGLDDGAFERNAGGKWSAGQDLQHLVRILRIINIVYALPLFILRILFGKSDQGSRDNHVIAKKYKEAMALAVKAPAPFVPGTVRAKERDALLSAHLQLGERLCRRIETMSEHSLDTYRMPHPVMGKVTLREMIVLTYLHTDHHAEITKRKVGKV
jgi:hypothetical protein